MHLLIVVADPFVSRGIVNDSRLFGEPVLVNSVAAARNALAGTPEWGAFVLDLAPLDGCGIALLRYARSSHPKTPALCLTPHLDADVVDSLFDLRATCLCKPLSPGRLRHFLRDASISDSRRVDRAHELDGDALAKHGVEGEALDQVVGELREEVEQLRAERASLRTIAAFYARGGD